MSLTESTIIGYIRVHERFGSPPADTKAAGLEILIFFHRIIQGQMKLDTVWVVSVGQPLDNVSHKTLQIILYIYYIYYILFCSH